jgi:hypothetical protein
VVVARSLVRCFSACIQRNRELFRDRSIAVPPRVMRNGKNWGSRLHSPSIPITEGDWLVVFIARQLRSRQMRRLSHGVSHDLSPLYRGCRHVEARPPLLRPQRIHDERGVKVGDDG